MTIAADDASPHPASTAHVRCLPHLSSPRRARETAAAFLDEVGGAPDLADGIVLVVSELATNAVLYAPKGAFEMVLTWNGAAVTVECSDTAWRREPVVGVCTAFDTYGRGLRVVAGCCSAWGVRVDADAGTKTVWAVLPFPRRPFE